MRCLQAIKQLGGHAQEADDALLVKVVVRSKLQFIALLDLNVNDVCEAAIVGKNDIEDRTDGFRLQRQDDEILSRDFAASAERRRFIG